MAESKPGARPAWVNFATGASAALSGWMFVHPFDLLKVGARRQTHAPRDSGQNVSYHYGIHFCSRVGIVGQVGIVALQSLLSLVVIPGVVGLIALEGLLGFSFPFYPFYAYNKEYHYGPAAQAREQASAAPVSTRFRSQVRAQLAGEVAGGGKVSVVQIAKTIVKSEGPVGLYAGLSAAAARQLSYGNLRLGIYSTLRDSEHHTVCSHRVMPMPGWRLQG